MSDEDSTRLRALIDRIEKEFIAWRIRELAPEWKTRLDEVEKRDVDLGGRGCFALQVYRELVEREVREQVRLIAEVVPEYLDWSLVSTPHIDRVRQHIMKGVDAQLKGLRDRFKRRARAADYPLEHLPHAGRYRLVYGEILDVVNAELGVLEAKAFNRRAADGWKMPDAAVPARTALNNATQSLTSAGWDAVEISFLSDERVHIRSGLKTETRNYAELGFADSRNGKPNQAWATLRSIAQERGVMRNGAKTGREWLAVEKRIQEIRKLFRKHFAITDDPLPFVEGTGYQALFKISCAPSFQT